MPGISPTSRTLKYLRTQGYEVGIVEHFNPYSRTRKDLFGFIDLVALGEKNIIGVQSCGQAFSEHSKKILNEPLAIEWLRSGGRILLIGWRKVKLRRGAKAMRWKPRIMEYKLEDFIRNKGYKSLADMMKEEK